MDRAKYIIPVIIAVKKLLVLVATTVMAFLAPLKLLLIGSLILVLIDFDTGKRAARKQGIPISSKGLYRTIIKFKDYAMLIIVSHIMKVIFFPMAGIDFATLAASFVAYVEFKSFCENMKVITGNEIWDKIFEILPNINFMKRKDGKS